MQLLIKLRNGAPSGENMGTGEEGVYSRCIHRKDLKICGNIIGETYVGMLMLNVTGISICIMLLLMLK